MAVLGDRAGQDREVHLAVVVDGDREVVSVPAGRVEPQPGRPEHTDGDEREGLEPYERRLLGELVDCDVAGGKDGDAVRAIDAVVPGGVGTKHLDVELATADD